MSSFTSNILLETTGIYSKGRPVVVVRRDFVFYKEYLGEKFAVAVPQGFATDMASIPRIFWPIFPPFGKYFKAAIVHDYLYQYPTLCTRKEADVIFLEAMKVSGVNKYVAGVMYAAVRLLGWRRYGK